MIGKTSHEKWQIDSLLISFCAAFPKSSCKLARFLSSYVIALTQVITKKYMPLWIHAQVISIVLTSDSSAVITSPWPAGLSPYFALNSLCKDMAGKNLVLFFTMKALLTPTYFFNSIKDKSLTNKVSPPTHLFFSSPSTSTFLNNSTACSKIFDSSGELFFLLSASFLIVDIYFEQLRHAQLHLI